MKKVAIEIIDKAAKTLEGVADKTALEFSSRLSEKYDANVYLKRSSFLFHIEAIP